MTINGRLVSNTAIVKRFQTEKSPLECQAPFPLEFCNLM